MSREDDREDGPLVSLDSLALADLRDVDPHPEAYRTDLVLSTVACVGAVVAGLVFGWVASAPVAVLASIPVVVAAVWGQLVFLAQGKRASRISAAQQERLAVRATRRHEEIVGISRRGLEADFKAAIRALLMDVGTWIRRLVSGCKKGLTVETYWSPHPKHVEDHRAFIEQAVSKVTISAEGLLRVAEETDDPDRVATATEAYWICYVALDKYRANPVALRAALVELEDLFRPIVEDWDFNYPKALDRVRRRYQEMSPELDNSDDPRDNTDP